jgi:hypothetical protein
MRGTQRALIETPIHRVQQLVPILLVASAQVTKFDQPVNKRFRQVEGNSTRSSPRRRRDRYMRRLPSSTVVEAVAR